MHATIRTFGRFQLRIARVSIQSANRRPHRVCPSRMDHHQSPDATNVGNPSAATRAGMPGKASLQRIAAGRSSRIRASSRPRLPYHRSVLSHLSRPLDWSTPNGNSSTRRGSRNAASRRPSAGPMQR